jgi:hypothetical protein
MVFCGMVGAALGGCDYLPGYYTYNAEVGYYEGGQQKWYIGSAKSYDGCIAEAASYFDSLKSPSNPKRAFTWACRKMRGEEFLDRVK